MGRNKMNFIDLCRGEFGRKIAYTGVNQITTANVRKVVSDTIGTHNRNRVLIDYLYRYYKGDQPMKFKNCEIDESDRNNKIDKNSDDHMLLCFFIIFLFPFC